MKTLGLLGGMSWESTVPYYRISMKRSKTSWGDYIPLGWFYIALILLK
jgi:aspartate/glutamate racemase